MNKTYKYTVATVLLALVFSFGNIVCMKFILQVREQKLLTESGTSVIDAPVQEWKIEGYSEPPTTEQMEEVLKSWEESSDIVVHEPVTGQISMEGAAKAGRQWLAEMGFDKVGQAKSEIKTTNVWNVYGTLSAVSVGESEAEAGMEPYYSFWRVELSNRFCQAFLYINAVTGKVWSADVVLYEDLPGEMSYENLRRFVDLSGLHTSDAIRRLGDSNALLSIDDSDLYAEMEFRYSKTGYPYSGYDETGLLDFRDKVLDRENVNIIFKLETGKY